MPYRTEVRILLKTSCRDKIRNLCRKLLSIKWSAYRSGASELKLSRNLRFWFGKNAKLIWLHKKSMGLAHRRKPQKPLNFHFIVL